MLNFVKRHLNTVTIIAVVAFTYYTCLSAKEFTWVFVSGDSGDWLAASNWWMVPQPYGAPLYILLGRVLSLLPGSLPVILTITLSVIPGTITVVLVYKLVQHLTNDKNVSIVSSVVLLGSAVFLTQVTVLEIYSLATCLLTASVYAYVKQNYKVTALLLGLSLSVHAVIIGVVLLWIIADHKNLLKPFITILVPITAIFYSVILLLMYLDTPPLIAGNLNIESLWIYLTQTSGAILGQLSVFEAPKRLLTGGALLLVSFGLGLPWVVKGLKRPWIRSTTLMVGVIVWFLWYYITCLDPLAWTFLTFASPCIAVLIGVGLSKVSLTHTKVVFISAACLALFNSVCLNAHFLTVKDHEALTYYEDLCKLPDDACVVVEQGSYSLGLYYVMSEGKDLTPLVHGNVDANKSQDFLEWFLARYNLNEEQVHTTYESDSLNLVQSLLDLGTVVYQARPSGSFCLLDGCFKYAEGTDCLDPDLSVDSSLKQIIGLTGQESLSPMEVIR